MLHLTIKAADFWDDIRNEFVVTDEYHLELEHSLYTISKWESKHKKPFLDNGLKSVEDTLDYVKCMCLDESIPDSAFRGLTNENVEEVNAYIKDPMTATTFSSAGPPTPSYGRKITAEVIYYLMLSYRIPMECEHWHLNKLLTLIKVFEAKNNPNPKKMSQRQVVEMYSRLNAERKKKYHTKG